MERVVCHDPSFHILYMMEEFNGIQKIDFGVNLINLYFHHSRASLHHATESTLRCGTKLLKQSQVYPIPYGRKVCKLHLKHMVTWLQLQHNSVK